MKQGEAKGNNGKTKPGPSTAGETAQDAAKDTKDRNKKWSLRLGVVSKILKRTMGEG